MLDTSGFSDWLFDQTRSELVAAEDVLVPGAGVESSADSGDAGAVPPHIGNSRADARDSDGTDGLRSPAQLLAPAISLHAESNEYGAAPRAESANANEMPLLARTLEGAPDALLADAACARDIPTTPSAHSHRAPHTPYRRSQQASLDAAHKPAPTPRRSPSRQNPLVQQALEQVSALRGSH